MPSTSRKRPKAADAAEDSQEAEQPEESAKPARKLQKGGKSAKESEPQHVPATDGRLGRSFFDQPCVNMAKALLGKVLVRKQPETQDFLKGRIVETEAYLGVEDKASQSFGGKKSGWGSNKAMFMDPGTAFVFSIFGKFDCLNISSQGEGAVVRIRALEPLEGLEQMTESRHAGGKNKVTKEDLCNGPGRLCQALSVTKSTHNQKDLTAGDCDLFVLDDGHNVQVDEILTATRIRPPATAGEWATKELRFYIKDNNYVSEK